jgi:hypothetical protein
MKTSFSRQEWCGHVYKQLLWDAGKIRTAMHSYFDGEGDASGEIDNPGGLSVDSLLLWARGMTEPRLKPGESRHTPFLGGLDGKGMPVWKPATAVRMAKANGQEVWSVKSPDGTWSVTVETAGERRILGWEYPGGEEAKLIRSARMKYWELNSPAGAAELAKLGLRIRPPRTM